LELDTEPLLVEIHALPFESVYDPVPVWQPCQNRRPSTSDIGDISLTSRLLLHETKDFSLETELASVADMGCFDVGLGPAAPHHDRLDVCAADPAGHGQDQPGQRGALLLRQAAASGRDAEPHESLDPREHDPTDQGIHQGKNGRNRLKLLFHLREDPTPSRGDSGYRKVLSLSGARRLMFNGAFNLQFGSVLSPNGCTSGPA